MRPLLFTELRKRFGRTVALDGIGGTIEPGRVVAIAGANGSGKSTFLKILAGALRADSGSIELPEPGDLAFMPERIVFARGWTARAWLELLASWRGAAPGRVDLLLAESGLAEAAGKPVSTFSHGMTRRLLYAQTRLGNPSLVALDEPEGGLDPVWMFRLEQELRRLRGEGKAVVFSTHAMDLAVDVADEIWIFRDGAILAIEAAIGWRGLDGAGRRGRLAAMLGP